MVLVWRTSGKGKFRGRGKTARPPDLLTAQFPSGSRVGSIGHLETETLSRRSRRIPKKNERIHGVIKRKARGIVELRK
jgi:hypothetical protein